MIDLFTLIVPVFNSEDYIERCIKSLINQSYRNLQIIIIDNGSTDSTPSIVSNIKDNRIEYLNCREVGVSNARNKGLENSRGQYIGFVDADDYIREDFCQKSVDFLKEKEADVLYFNYFKVTNGIEKKNIIKKKFMCDGMDLSTSSIDMVREGLIDRYGYRGFVWNKVFRKKAIGDIRFDANIAFLEDLIFNLKVIKNHPKIIVSDLPLYFYVFNPNSTVNNFSKKNLTYIDALFEIKNSTQENKNLTKIINREIEIALLNFGYEVWHNSMKKEYFSLKKKFTEIKKERYVCLKPYNFNELIKDLLRIISRLSFKTGCILYGIIKKRGRIQINDFVPYNANSRK